MSNSASGRALGQMIRALDRLKWTSTADRHLSSPGEACGFCWRYRTPIYQVDVELFPTMLRVKFTGFYGRNGSYEHVQDCVFEKGSYAASMQGIRERWVTRFQELMTKGRLWDRDTASRLLGVPQKVYEDLLGKHCQMTVWVTKRWSTEGIELVDVEFHNALYCYLKSGNGSYDQYGPKDWHLSYDDAVRSVLARIESRRESLAKQMDRMEKFSLQYDAELRTRDSENFRQDLNNRP